MLILCNYQQNKFHR